MLVCAVLAALTAGVLVAYAVCLGLFGIFRMSASRAEIRTAEELPLRVSAAAAVVEG
jgi:hypothetical protein